ncbi:MAG: hypothetical protein ACPL6C_03125, partial [bacterium]
YARDGDGSELGEIRNSENMITFTFCKRFMEKLSVGLNVNYVQAYLYKLSTYAVGIDFGLDIILMKNKLELGFAYKNSGLTYSWNSSDIYEYGASVNEGFPELISMGISYRDSVFIPFMVLGALEKSEDLGYKIKLGLETAFLRILNLRCGYNGDKPSFGFSLTRKQGKYQFELGYTFILSPLELPSAHSFGLLVGF